MERKTFIFRKIKNIALQSFESGQPVTAEKLLTQLEEVGVTTPGDPDMTAKELVTAACDWFFPQEDGDALLALTSVFTDSCGLPLLIHVNGKGGTSNERQG